MSEKSENDAQFDGDEDSTTVKPKGKPTASSKRQSASKSDTAKTPKKKKTEPKGKQAAPAAETKEKQAVDPMVEELGEEEEEEDGGGVGGDGGGGGGGGPKGGAGDSGDGGGGDGDGDDTSSDDDWFQPTKIAKTAESTATSAGPAPQDKIDPTIEVPEGRTLACPLNSKCVATGRIVASSAKVKNGAPTSVKVSVSITNIEGGGKDILRTGTMTSFLVAEQEPVTTAAGTHPHAILIPTDVTPTVKITCGILQCTLMLKGGKGEKESQVQKLVPGAIIQLTNTRFSKRGMDNVYMSCEEFKVTTAANREAPREGAMVAVDTVRASGNALAVSAGFHCTAFRGNEPPADNVAAAWTIVKEAIGAEKAAFAIGVRNVNPHYDTPTSEMLLVDEESNTLAPVLCFHRTKVEHPKVLNTGLLWNGAEIAVFYSRNGKYKNPETLHKAFNGAPIVATDFEGCARPIEAGRLGTLYTIATTLSFVPDYATSAPARFNNILKVPGPFIKAPVSFFAAPFGVNVRSIADLLMENVIPFANMIVMPNKCKIYALTYEDTSYTQDCLLDAQSQLTIDVRTTLRNVALLLSAKTIAKLYDGAPTSTPVVASGGALTDMLAEDSMPTISTLANYGGVVSLFETAVTFDDPTLEFYGVVTGMANIAKAEGNLHCGTDPSIGEAAFEKALGGTKLTEKMKWGAAAVFAVRVSPKKISVASSSTVA